MRTVCQDKAWTQNAEVLCEYGGGLLIYPLEEVQRIEKTIPPPSEADTVAEDLDGPPSAAGAKPAEAAKPQGPGAAGSKAPAPAGAPFYDPRRPKKYWSSPSRHHDSFPEAVQALAEEFGRSPRWIEGHLIDTNDLEALRAHLKAQSAAGVPAPLPEAPPADSTPFYDPRRPEKYHTGPGQRHASYAEAVTALAREFQMTVDQVEGHMGDSNQVEIIRRNLAAAKAAGASEDAPPAETRGPARPRPE
jgi:hypothetical protein